MLESTIKFSDQNAKDLFFHVMENHAVSIEAEMTRASSILGNGSAEPVVEVGDGVITVTSVPSDKGPVIVAPGDFIDYKLVDVGQAYGVVKNSQVWLFKKAGEGIADVGIGIAPSFHELLDSLDRDDFDVQDVKPIVG